MSLNCLGNNVLGALLVANHPMQRVKSTYERILINPRVPTLILCMRAYRYDRFYKLLP